MHMLREVYHPNAYLVDFRNIKLGLRARTHILNALERGSADAKTIGKDTRMSYGVVMHHLKLLEARGIVHRKGGKPSLWTLTGLGQKRLQ
jgi:predicted transcriptional regulator